MSEMFFRKHKKIILEKLSTVLSSLKILWVENNFPKRQSRLVAASQMTNFTNKL